LTISDDIVLVGNRYYVKSTAKITNGVESVENVAYARESETKKGMDDAQVTGSTSSYARKYALNGLFAIDDTKDSDFDNSKPKNDKVFKPKEDKPYRTPISDAQIKLLNLIIHKRPNPDELKAWILKTYNIDSISKMFLDDANKLIKKLNSENEQA
jgi:hypothetical protein